MQTITTKYLGATNTKGSRIKAKSTNRSSISDRQNHENAVRTLCEKLNWHGQYVSGTIDNTGVQVWCRVLDTDILTIERI